MHYYQKVTAPAPQGTIRTLCGVSCCSTFSLASAMSTVHLRSLWTRTIDTKYTNAMIYNLIMFSYRCGIIFLFAGNWPCSVNYKDSLPSVLWPAATAQVGIGLSYIIYGIPIDELSSGFIWFSINWNKREIVFLYFNVIFRRFSRPYPNLFCWLSMYW